MSRHCVVIDNGSGLLKAGFNSETAPRRVIPSVVGYLKSGSPRVRGSPMLGVENYLGDAALEMRGALDLSYPQEHGIVVDWAEMELLWENVFEEELCVDIKEYPLFMTEPPLNPKANREAMTQIIFERFSVPGFHVSTQAPLSLYASGKTTGLVLDSGDGVTHCVPVFDGYSLHHCVSRIDVGGRDVTDYLANALLQKGYSIRSSGELEVVREMKEKLCYVAEDFDKEMKKYKMGMLTHATFSLPDGNSVVCGEERFTVPEMLFNGSVFGKEIGGNPGSLVVETIQKADPDIQKELYSGIILSGGTTLIRGYGRRLRKDVRAKSPGHRVKVTEPRNRGISVWKGGAIITSLPTFDTMWITEDEYDDIGPNVVFRKCFF